MVGPCVSRIASGASPLILEELPKIILKDGERVNGRPYAETKLIPPLEGLSAPGVV